MNISKLFIPFFVISIFLFQTAFAGPPFTTDDPQPVEFMHWEFYVSSAMNFAGNESDLTLPHFEINYGLVHNIQVHLLAPLDYNHSNDGSIYGYSDTELGVKYRFINSDDGSFQVGTFPLVLIPSGNKNTNLGDGYTRIYVPIWIQKSAGKFTTYGGGGFWYNPGPGHRNWGFAGWEAQYDLSETITLGGEVYYQTADNINSKSNEGFSVGGYINMNEHNHILFSVGKTLNGENSTTGYLGYQLTI
jgi:hypothetical protein